MYQISIDFFVGKLVLPKSTGFEIGRPKEILNSFKITIRHIINYIINLSPIGIEKNPYH